MKELSAMLLVLCLMLGMSAACAESNTAGDYSWLDDLTINQLKELDGEIHKRIPYEGEGTAELKDHFDTSVLLGKWEYILPADYSVDKSVSWYGHKFRYTIEFFESGFGKMDDYDLTKNKLSANGSFTYEMLDASTVSVRVASLIGEYTIGYKLLEDAEGLALIKIEDESFVYRKVDEK